MSLPVLISKKWLVSTGAALGMHAAVLFGGAAVFIQAPQYGVEANTGGVEIYLTAALPSSAKTDVSPEKSKEVEPENLEKKDYSLDNKSEFAGDGSSQEVGENKTSFYSSGQGRVEDKPGYLKNPPPSYPQAALDRGQQGRVILSVDIDVTGRASNVSIKESSGFRSLDDSALKAVRKWKFEPAKLGRMPVASKADVPIRFVLEDELKRRAGL